MTQQFVHLRLHSEYSIIDGLVRIPALMKKAAALNMPAVAMTDFSNLFAHFVFIHFVIYDAVCCYVFFALF